MLYEIFLDLLKFIDKKKSKDYCIINKSYKPCIIRGLCEVKFVL